MTASKTASKAKTKSSASKRSAASRSAASRPNPFKKAGESISAGVAEAGKQAQSANRAAYDAGKDAFAYGQQFTQANDWMRNGAEAMQQVWQQTLGFNPMQQMNGAANGAAKATKAAAAAATNPLGKAGDVASRSLNEIVALGSDHMATMSECGNAVATLAKDMGQEIMQIANTLFSDQVELSKAMFQCRNIDDMLELQGKASRLAVDAMFTESVRLGELAFRGAAEMAEPIQQRVAQTAERLTKMVAA